MDIPEEKIYPLKTWVRLVKERDGHRCQMEDCAETGELEAHHITPRSMGGANTLDNGITLCREHHQRAFLRAHLRSQVESKTQRIFSKNTHGKKEAAYRFLTRKRLMEKARPHGPWLTDESK
jgi:5-methylcytosine-specific restriction endonuclease McrA